MAGRLDRWVRRRGPQAWDAAAQAAGSATPDDLRDLRGQARALRRRLDRTVHLAEARLAEMRRSDLEVPRPLGTDWVHRPEVFAGPIVPSARVGARNKERLGEEIEVFHDCVRSEVTVRQVARPGGAVPHALKIDVFGFDGSYLSLALAIPAGGVAGLKRRHVVRLDADLASERPMEIFARLNIRHGPNTEQIVRELPVGRAGSGSERLDAEFDIAYTDFNETRAEAMWLDLIFEGAEMNEITIRDLTLSRRPRAAF